MSFNTGNTVPSADAKDLSDNAENFDSAVNTQIDTFTDRLGITRDTVVGRLKKMGYTVPVVYAGAILFTVNDNVKTVEEGSVVYAPLPSALPFTTSGTFVGDDDARFFVVQGIVTSDLPQINIADIAQIYSQNTVATMLSEVINYPDNKEITTKGYSVVGDKGAASYTKITGTSTANGIDRLAHDTLSVTFVLKETGYIIPEQYGLAVGVFSHPSYIDGIGVAESSSVAASWNFSRLDGFGFISSDSTNNAGWLADASEEETIDVEMPFAVIIGDSIAEGHPALHGRLDWDGAGGTDLNWPNSEGQPSYELSCKTNMHYFNQGIGGQTSAQVLARFNRDALGQDFDAGDGRPTITLTRAPKIIWVNVGINDVSALIDTAVTKSNLIKMAVSAQQNGMMIGFNTIGPVNSHDAAQRLMQDDINQFILNELSRYGVMVFDYHTWFVNPADATTVNPRLDADGVHPSKAGYTSYGARLISQNPNLVVNSIIIENKFDQENIPASAVNLLGVNVTDGALDEFEQLFDRQARVNHVFDMTNIVNLTITASQISGGVDLAKSTGISKVSVEMGARSAKCGTLQATITKDTGVWVLAGSGFVGNGIAVGVTGADIGLIFDRNVKSVEVTHVGSSAPINYKSTGLTPSNASTIKLWNQIDNSALSAAVVGNGSTFQVIAKY